MSTYCGANCEACPSKGACRGCIETGGSPFGGRGVAADTGFILICRFGREGADPELIVYRRR